MTYMLPTQAVPNFNEALRLHQNGCVAEAEKAYVKILAAEPSHPGSLHLLGVVRQQQGRHEEALELIGQAVAMVPDKAVYRNNLGAACFALGRHAEALGEFQRAVALHPLYADAWANLGMAQAAQGETSAAEASLRRALRIQPWHRDATTRLASLLGRHGRYSEARKLLHAAIAAAPCAEFHAALGNLLLNAGLPDQAAEQYRAVIALNPGDAMANFNLGNACEELHDTDEARQCFAQAAELRPEKRLLRLRADICGPVVFETGQEIEEYCEKVESVLEEWKAETPSPPAPLPSTGEGSKASSPPAPLPGHHVPMVGARGASLNDILEAGVFPSFDLAYHGREQRRLKEQFAALYEPYFRDGPPPAGSNNRNRPRLGILVTRRHEGMFLKSMQGIIEQLDGERFEPVILCSQAIVKTLQTKIRREGLRFVPFGDSLPEAIRQVREAACDLIY